MLTMMMIRLQRVRLRPCSRTLLPCPYCSACSCYYQDNSSSCANNNIRQQLHLHRQKPLRDQGVFSPRSPHTRRYTPTTGSSSTPRCPTVQAMPTRGGLVLGALGVSLHSVVLPHVFEATIMVRTGAIPLAQPTAVNIGCPFSCRFLSFVTPCPYLALSLCVPTEISISR